MATLNDPPTKAALPYLLPDGTLVPRMRAFVDWLVGLGSEQAGQLAEAVRTGDLGKMLDLGVDVYLRRFDGVPHARG